MSENTKIEWCDHTVNPWHGCTKVSPGCANCYADVLSRRFGKDIWGAGKPRENHLAGARKTSMKLNQQAYRLGMRPRVFCASMADWLDDEVPVEWLADLLDIIRRTPNLDWLLLTKRPENWRKRVTDAIMWNWCEDDQAAMLHAWGRNWLAATLSPDNVWIGTTVEDQKRADERTPLLLQIPAKVRFLSCEPLLGPLDLFEPLGGFDQCPRATMGIDWLICGGESGPKARPMEVEWARSLRDQCSAAGVPFFMKQMGGTRKPFPPIPDDLMIRQFPA